MVESNLYLGLCPIGTTRQKLISFAKTSLFSHSAFKIRHKKLNIELSRVKVIKVIE